MINQSFIQAHHKESKKEIREKRSWRKPGTKIQNGDWRTEQNGNSQFASGKRIINEKEAKDSHWLWEDGSKNEQILDWNNLDDWLGSGGTT